MRYLVDEREAEPEERLAMYRLALPWAARQGDRAAVVVRPADHHDPAVLRGLLGLGPRERDAGPGAGTVGDDEVRVVCAPDARFVAALTGTAAPAGAISGDLSPAVDVVVYLGRRRLYGCYDYGRVQMMALRENELESLRAAFREAGIDPARIVPAPPYVAGQEEDEG